MKTLNRKNLFLSVLVVIILLLVFVVPVFAVAMPTSIFWPDVSGPTIATIDAYQNYLITGDELWVVNYVASYTAGRLPSVTIDKAYLGTASTTTSTTALATVAPYPYFNSGYGTGYFAMYWATGGPTFSGAYQANLFGSPTGYNWLTVTAASALVDYEYWNGAAYTDQTAQANSAAANDITLPYAAVNNVCYMGSTQPFNTVKVNLGTSGAGAWIITWEYYNGTWTALYGTVDDTNGWTATPGNYNVTYTMPTDWQPVSVNGGTAYYYVRARVSSYTSSTVAPIGTQMWVNGNNASPSVTNTTINWHVTSGQTATDALLAANVISWAVSLSSSWSTPLTTTGVGGTILSAYGEQYFGNVIPGLAQAVPNIYPAGLSGITINQNYTPPAPTAAASSEAASPVQTGGLSGWVGLGDTAFRALAFAAFYGFLVFILGAAMRRMDFAMLALVPVIPICAALGAINWIIVILITVLLVFAALWSVVVQRGAA